MTTVRYNGVDYTIDRGQDLLGGLLEHHASIGYLCMSGSCGTCRIHVESGDNLLSPPANLERAHGCDGDERLACQAIIIADGTIILTQG